MPSTLSAPPPLPRGDEATMIENGTSEAAAPSVQEEQQPPQPPQQQQPKQPLEGLAMKDGVYKVPVMGSDDYLATMVINDSADATAASMEGVADVIDAWQRQAAAEATGSTAAEGAAPAPALQPPQPPATSDVDEGVPSPASDLGEGATATLPELVSEIKGAMGYGDGTTLAAALTKAASDLGIEIADGTAKSKANRIAEELGIEARC
jgi:hypothetical protein